MSRRSRIRRQGWQLLEGDSEELLQTLPDNTCDSMVTDPPAGISFMGAEWDKDKGGRDEWIRWLAGIMFEALRVLKPGAHGLVWAIPRTSHWTAMALESAGFEVRDVISHHFGTGFPKNLDLGEGRGTALKPATEHWILVRKPCPWSIAKTLREYGTGAINIDATRIDDRWPANLVLSHSDDCIISWRTETRAIPKQAFSFRTGEEGPGYEVVFDGEDIVCADHCPVKLLDGQSGELHSGARDGKRKDHSSFGLPKTSGDGFCEKARDTGRFYGASSGGASRFFYCAKPDRGERDLGCGHLPWRTGGELTGRQEGSAGLANPRAGAGRTSGGRNLHPTCKSLRLMRWLCRLITPPGGLVLDPFTGSGSTGAAALAEGFRFLGMELSPEYAEIARARLSYVAAHPDQVPEP
ncbi:MAG: site-specific DNA-methyltransferase [Anaerolineae bacterium]|nr:site-specific DNA-methyltransferase [Thermoplasmata archaeon]NIV34260.1 site-specific DNA-methyltransferase [Anaerolineae bacterium]NIY06109.1 site-specific DNA-methyltransferase [Thermoplasmata archaeon]